MNQRLERADADQQLDRDLAAMLSAEPSPEFLARVRMRIAREPEPSKWHWSWAFAAVGAAALLLVVSGSAWRAGRTHSDSAVMPPRTAEAADVPLAALPAVPARVVSAASPASLPSARRTHGGTIAVGPDERVLVNEAEAKALGRLLASAREGRVELGPLPEAVPATVALAPVAAIAIPAIHIEPLPEGGEGARP